MSKRNELLVLAISLVATVAILGGGAWFLTNRIIESSRLQNQNALRPAQLAGKLDTDKADGSAGVSVLPEAVSPSKQRGLNALANEDYATAQLAFEAALMEERNDPESLIYLNNAKIGSGESYTIALIVPAEGVNVGAAKELMRGAAQAQSKINDAEDGINKTPLKIIIVNDNDDADTAKSVAANLVASKEVLGVVGHFSSGTTLATLDIYEAGHLTMISPTSTAVAIADAEEYIFRTVPSDRLAAKALARHVVNTLNKKNVAVFYNGESAYSKSIASQFRQELKGDGGDVVDEFDIIEPGFRVADAMQTANEKGAEAIMMALTLTPIEVPLTIMSLNQRVLPMLGSDSLYSSKILEFGAANAQGLTVAVPWHILNHQDSPFVKASLNLWGADINWRTATAYDAVMSLVEGMRTDPTREGIGAALAKSDFQAKGATDSVQFFQTGDRNQLSQLVEIVSGSRSGSEYDFVPVQ